LWTLYKTQKPSQYINLKSSRPDSKLLHPFQESQVPKTLQYMLLWEFHKFTPACRAVTSWLVGQKNSLQALGTIEKQWIIAVFVALSESLYCFHKVQWHGKTKQILHISPDQQNCTMMQITMERKRIEDEKSRKGVVTKE